MIEEYVVIDRAGCVVTDEDGDAVSFADAAGASECAEEIAMENPGQEISVFQKVRVVQCPVSAPVWSNI